MPVLWSLRVIERALSRPSKSATWVPTGVILFSSFCLAFESLAVGRVRLEGLNLATFSLGLITFSVTATGVAWRHWLGDPLLDAATKAVEELRKPYCPACGPDRVHTDDECVALRPICHVEDCTRKTCIQALIQGRKPTCLHHFYEGGVDGIKTRYERLLDDDTAV